jgi:hypothetical protein
MAGNGGAAAAEAARAKQYMEEEEERQKEAAEASAVATQAAREAFESSDQQLVHDQIAEAEAAMRGPNMEVGNPGDPTKGPSS